QPQIERFEPFGGLEQQGRRVATAAQRECDLPAQQVDLRAPELVQRPGLCDRQQSDGCVERTRVLLGLGRGQRPPSPTRGLGRERGGALQERGGGRQPTARLSAARRALKLRRDLLVETWRRVRKM